MTLFLMKHRRTIDRERLRVSRRFWPLAGLAVLGIWLAWPVDGRGQQTADLPGLTDDADLAELVQPTAPKTPAEALNTFETTPAFHLELVAAEPLVESPVAAAFDEEGRLYVAEMRDYPFRPQAGEKPLGRIRRLVDTDGDGTMDRSSVFADELLWPTGIGCWKDGIFVAAAPHIYYLQDADGDGCADRREVIFSGFGTQNEQGSVNNLGWGIDGKIYGASSMNGGEVVSRESGSEEVQSVKGRDFCFDPRDPQLELVSGNSQFGIAWDDWGHRFLCDQANPNKYVVIEDRYLIRNPHLRVRDTVDDLARGVTPIFRASPPEGWRVIRSRRRLASGERSAQSSGASHDVLDGVAGPAIYRGDAYPPEFRGNLIVGDAQNNLIHRRILKRHGATFTSARADEGLEFVRSTDNWFRPVNVFHAPDGTLYVCDMGREIIESVHVPLDVWKHLDLRRGRDRGRIYRIAPDGFRYPARPQLSRASSTELVQLLSHRNGWWRDTAQRLLMERRESARRDQAVAEALANLVRMSAFPQARLHALYVMRDWQVLEPSHLQVLLTHPEAELRAHAVRLSEPWLGRDEELLAAILQRADDDQPAVRLQVALSLGLIPIDAAGTEQVADALAKLAHRDGADKWGRIAILSAAGKRAAAVLNRLQLAEPSDRSSGQETLWSQLAYASSHGQDEAGVARLLDTAATRGLNENSPELVQALVLGLHAGWRGTGSQFLDHRTSWSAAAIRLVHQMLAEAKACTGDTKQAETKRLSSTRLLRCDAWQSARVGLLPCLEPHEVESIQRSAVETLSEFDQPEIADALLEHWSAYRPAMREAVLAALFRRREWTELLVTALERGQVQPQHLSAAQRAILANHEDHALRARAAATLAAVEGSRAATVSRYQPALQGTGDPKRGAAIYLRECMACHQVRDQGFAVGPNLALVRNRTPDELLVQILDPNREVQPVYVQYIATDVQGGIATGMVAADTATSITLRRDRNQEQTIAKSDIEQLASSDKSLMPEGLENNIRVEEMADLLAFLQSLQYDIGTEPGRDEPEQGAR